MARNLVTRLRPMQCGVVLCVVTGGIATLLLLFNRSGQFSFLDRYAISEHAVIIRQQPSGHLGIKHTIVLSHRNAVLALADMKSSLSRQHGWQILNMDPDQYLVF